MTTTIFSGTTEYHFTEEVMVEIEYDAEVEYEKVEGSFSKDAASDWDYRGYEDVRVDQFKITKAILFIDGEEIREWNNEDHESLLTQLSVDDEIQDCVCDHVEANFLEGL